MKKPSVIWIAIIWLAFCLAAWLGACTRTADLVETPLLPPAAARTQAAESANAAGNTLSEPTPTAAVIAIPTETPASPTAAQLYAVVYLEEGEVLNVRSGAGVTNDIVDSLPANARDLQITGKQQDVDGVNWMEIQLSDGVVGWVSGRFLTLQVPAPQFCSDAQVGTLLDSLINAIRNQDGAELARLASPIHGLTFQYHIWGSAVTVTDPQALGNLFNSTVDYEWMITDEGVAITGSFKDNLLPPLEDVLLQSHSRHCNTLEQGVAAGVTQDGVYWPYDYRGLNYVSLFRPAPADNEQDWRTWVVGIEYVAGKPYLAVLLQFTY